MLATSSGCKLLDRDTFGLDSDVGEGDDDECRSFVGERGMRDVAPWSLTSRSPWNRTRRDVGVGGSVWLAPTPIPGLAGDVADSCVSMPADAAPVVDVDTDADAPDDGRGGGGSSGILDAWEGVQFWMHLRGSRSRACISLQCNCNLQY